MKKKEQSTNNSQLEQANRALKSIAANITSDDRKAAPVSQVTIVDYLKGRGKDLGTATKLLEFFSQRISDRARLINSVPSH